MTKLKLNHRQVLAAARFLARKRFPYFSAALFTLMPKPVPGMLEFTGGKSALACTPNGVLVYDPDEIEKWDIDDVEFGLLNIVGHLLRGSAKQRETNSYDPQLWNQACDAAINDDLFAAGVKPRPSDMLPQKIQDPDTMRPMEDGMTELAYYRALKQMDDPPQPEPGARPGGGCSGGIGGNPTPGEDQHDGRGSGSGNGSGGSNSNQPPPPGRSDAELERVRKQVARDVQQHAEKGRGSVPGGWQVWAASALKPPKIRWQDKLNRCIRGAVSRQRGMIDYSRHAPSRRQAGIGYGPGKPLLPTMVAPNPVIAVAVDTSGSMSSDDLARAVAECKGILDAQAGTDIHLLSCDAEVHGPPRKVKSWKEVQQTLKGGGGTDFSPIFEAVRAIPEKPGLCIVLTDGGGPAPAIKPGFDVIWVLIGKKNGGWNGAMVPWVEGQGTDKKVAYGEMIWVDD